MVVRLLNKTKKDDFVTPPAQQSITVSRSNSEPIFSINCSITTAMQMRRMAALEKTKLYNIAFKLAAVVHAREKGKDDGQLQT